MSDVDAPFPPGTPCWVDQMARDQQAALDFYRDLFGWEGTVGPEELGGYAVCTLRGRPVAGIGAAMAEGGQPPPPTAWTTYLASADADASGARVTAAGGRVLTPTMDVGDAGRMFVAQDESGAVFGVWQPRAFPGARVVNEPGAVCWNMLNTRGPVAEATSFYRDVFDMMPESSPVEDGSVTLSVRGRPVAGVAPMSEQCRPDVPSHWLTFFAVDDTDATVEAAVRAGSTESQPPTDIAPGRMAVLADPQGAPFGVIALAERPA